MGKYCARATVPGWLKDLPPGEYSTVELCKITKQSRQNIFIRFDALSVEKKIRKIKHQWINFYTWLGESHYKKEE